MARNRALLRARIDPPTELHWLRQVHGWTAADVAENPRDCQVNAVITTRPQEVCAVLTADCLPLAAVRRGGGHVAAVHAGSRYRPERSCASDRPSVRRSSRSGPRYGRVLAQGGEDTKAAFVPTAESKWLANLYVLARERLHACGVDRVGGCGFCTYSDSQRFFSYRRDKITGRMVSLI